MSKAAVSTVSLLTLSLFLGGCFSLKIGPGKEDAQVQMSGLADGYVIADALEPYDGTILQTGVFKGTRRSREWVSLDVWPLFGVGVGFVGARVRVLFLEAGLGLFGYNPSARRRHHHDHDDDVEVIEIDIDDDEIQHDHEEEDDD